MQARAEETLDFSQNPPRLRKEVLLKKIRSNFARSAIVHVFFTGVTVRVIRGNDFKTVDNAYQKMPAKLIGVHNRNEQGQPHIERTIINDAEEAIRQWYG